MQLTQMHIPGSSPSTDVEAWRGMDLAGSGASTSEAVLAALGTSPEGLSDAEAARRLKEIGPNAIESHGVRPVVVFLRQLQNPLLILLGVATATAFFFGERTDALIISVILALSIGLGFFNEYRSERALAALHARIRHQAMAVRGGKLTQVDVTQLVPGDVVLLDVGDVVAADLRLLEVHALECDEAVLTGESMTAAKTAQKVAPGASSLKLPSCAFMGTVVRAGTGRAVVVRTGATTTFGRIATQLARRPAETAFQLGLRDFSLLLVRVTAVLTISIFVLNALLGRSLLEAALFSLAVAVGLTPQLLPAIVTISLSLGARRLAARSVLVKRLVSIEDLGNIEVLFTDKTGTLTEGRITFEAAVDLHGQPSTEALTLGLVCNSAAVEDGRPVGGNPLDRALWEGAGDLAPAALAFRRLAEAPFDYDRKLMSVLVEDKDGYRRVVTKGAPEAVLARCALVPEATRETLDRQFAAGFRVVAVASKQADGLTELHPEDERDLSLDGMLTFIDPLKPDAGRSLGRLARLGVTVKIVTGDNDRVARKACTDLGIPVSGVLTGAQLDALPDSSLQAALPQTTIFARVTPEQKSRIIRLQRASGTDVGFLGDGVNDAVALHDADVGISVESATDVAKDAADIVLLEKDLDILADGVAEGRRIFSNTIKYVLMGTSSNFGNMFSAAGASLVLPFLPMTPTQILLNNLLYDVSEMTIPTDRVDEELLQRPAHWDMAFIRRFMLFFGPISSVFDFLTFGVMLWVFHATHSLFQTGWFVESLATQTLVIFIIRTRRVPFLRSAPSTPLLVTSLASVAVGALVPFSPLASLFGFTRLPAGFFGILVAMIVTYLLLAELGKTLFFRPERGVRPLAHEIPPHHRWLLRRGTRWSVRHRDPSSRRPQSTAAPAERA
ncbi:MAG TPA: magnesium-translocating P-type ATPase [Candidatus Dormibacteraeota bacterium]|nr:magnesium-translocating P-type ATPase [Candidatus Dormibacteraeota bacterium]